MDPTIVGALITSLTDVGVAVWSRSPSNKSNPEVAASRFVDEHFDSLRQQLTGGCVRVLRQLEPGENREKMQLLRVLHRDMPPDSVSIVEREFEYRLYYLQLLGLIQRSGSEWMITEIGRKFVAKARALRLYSNELS